MPLKVVCGNCNEVLYEGWPKSIADVIRAYIKEENVSTGDIPLYDYVARCPRCRKALTAEELDKKMTVLECK